MREVIQVDGLTVSVRAGGDADYISLTDLARQKSDDPSDVIRNWMRNRNTIEFLGIWEVIHNPGFKPVEFDGFRKEAGLNSFTMTPTKWVKTTNAIGVQVKPGRHGGTYAHVEIALDFATWISPEFRLRVLQEYQQLKADETSRLNVEWQQNRLFSAMNYRVHTDAVRDSLPKTATHPEEVLAYAQEADVLNLAVFGMTAKQWRDANPEAPGNIRDYASATQLLVLNNLEAINAMLIRQGHDREDRYRQLAETALQQKESFEQLNRLKQISKKDDDR